MRPVRLPLVLLVIPLAAALVVLPAPRASAGPGDPDPGFGGGDGIATIDLAPSLGDLNAVAVAPDGAIVAAGLSGPGPAGPPATTDSVVVARFLANGSPDTSFSTDGFDTTPSGSGIVKLAGVAVQADGKILAATSSALGWRVVRFLATGGLDTSYSGDGIAIVTPPGHPTALAVDLAVEPDGQLVIAGNETGTDEDQFVAVRVDLDGTLDDGFGLNGVAAEGSALQDEDAWGVDVAPDGDIVVAGRAFPSVNEPEIAVLRLTPGGDPDTAFGDAGWVITAVGTASYARAVDVASNGTIAVTGATPGAGGSEDDDFVLARYTAGGALDGTFSGDGIAKFAFSTRPDLAEDVLVQPGGSIIAVGGGFSGLEPTWALLRALPNGAADPTFGDAGKVMVDPAGNAATAAALDAQSRVLVAGEGGAATGDLTVMRLDATSPDVTPPVTTIVRPRHNLSYIQANLTVFNGSASDASGVALVQVALRRYFTNGTCANWNGSKFVAGSCSQRIFVNATGTGSWSYALPRVLTKSQGTNVAHYVLLARSWDNVPNIEGVFNNGRNRVQFEIV